MIKSVAKQGHAQVIGVDVDPEVAKVILSKKRERGEGKRLEGRFEFIWIGNEHDGGFLGRVRAFPTNEVFSVEINHMDLTTEDMEAVFRSLQDKRDIVAHINAWYVGDKITRAIVMKADFHE